MIEEKKAFFEIPNNISISKETIRSRIKRKNYDPQSCGNESPVAEAEETLLQMCISMGKIRQPLIVSECIMLMNSLIDGTEMQKNKLTTKQNWDFQIHPKLDAVGMHSSCRGINTGS